MTADEIIELAKEKLGKDLTEQEAEDYLNGKTPLPDEALELISGGSSKCASIINKIDEFVVDTAPSKCNKCKAFTRYIYIKEKDIWRCKKCKEFTRGSGQVIPPEVVESYKKNK